MLDRVLGLASRRRSCSARPRRRPRRGRRSSSPSRTRRSSSPAGWSSSTACSSPPTTPATPAGSSSSTGSGKTVGVTTGPTTRPTSRRSRRPARARSGSATSATTPSRATRSRCSGCRSGAATRTVTPAVYDLVYPDGPHDAETLMTDPRTGRLYVVTKGIFGGTLYAAPTRLSADHPNGCGPSATCSRSPPTARSSPTAGTSWSATTRRRRRLHASRHEQVASFQLPAQQQGEGLAVGPDGPTATQHGGPVQRRAADRVPAEVAAPMDARVGAAGRRGRRARSTATPTASRSGRGWPVTAWRLSSVPGGY